MHVPDGFEARYDPVEGGWWLVSLENPEARRFWPDEPLTVVEAIGRELDAWDWCDAVRAHLSGAVLLTSEPHRIDDNEEP